MEGKSRFPRIIITLVLGLFVCGWMFFLGILVGRGTAPISFDTKSFQAHLAKIADDSEKQEKTFERPVLDFYEVLKSPVLLTTVKVEDKKEGLDPKENPDQTVSQGEILPVKADASIAQEVKNPQIQKKSLKAMTFKSKPVVVQKIVQKEDVSPVASTVASPVASSVASPVVPPVASPVASPEVEKTVVKTDKKILDSNVENGDYTIQVAAFRDLADAVHEIDRLEAKGVSCYRTMGRVGNDIWHRVRTGSFKDMESAKKRLGLLAGYGIKGIILNKKEL